MAKQKQVTIKLDVRQAAAVRQILFEHQKGYSYEFPSERINDVRDVIRNLDTQIESTLQSK
jgi:hypothetical protein